MMSFSRAYVIQLPKLLRFLFAIFEGNCQFGGSFDFSTLLSSSDRRREQELVVKSEGSSIR